MNVIQIGQGEDAEISVRVNSELMYVNPNETARFYEPDVLADMINAALSKLGYKDLSIQFDGDYDADYYDDDDEDDDDDNEEDDNDA